MSIEFWQAMFPPFQRAAERAQAAEADGWDGVLIAENQHLSPDPYPCLALAANATEKLRLGTGVTNPLTRHPSVISASIATIQLLSGGRAVLGIGRGDSSVAYLGRKPVSTASFTETLTRVQGYLAGEKVEAGGVAHRLEWLDPGLPKVPLDVAATGPRTIEVGARLAERLTFAVGADPERVAKAIGIARAARTKARLDADAISLGAYLNLLVEPDVARGRDHLRGAITTFTRFSAMSGQAIATLDGPDRDAAERVARVYDMSQHASASADHATLLDDAYVDRFGIIGDASHCIARLTDLIELGLDHFVILGWSRFMDEAEAARYAQRFAREVIPATQGLTASER
jgi:5,10-methylenetetrahydromethanopterin reductase